MNSDLPQAIIKNPDPLAVPQLQTLYSKAGIQLQGVDMFWLGNDESGQRYRLNNSTGESFEIKVVSFLSEDEKIIFRAFQDWFRAAIRKISDAVRGYYTFDVLQFEVGDAPWSWSEFSVLLIKHAGTLLVGERQLIQFGALWGVLHKRTEADFGRVESKLMLNFYKPSPEALMRLIKKQSMQMLPGPDVRVVFRDLSRLPLCLSQADFELLAAELRLKNADVMKVGSSLYWHPASKQIFRV